MSKIKILLAEDEPNFGTVLQSYLRLADYEVYWAKNGKEAIEKAKEKRYNLFLLDVMMPEVDGFSVAKAIRKKDKKTPIIFLTAKSFKEDVLRGYKIGADDYLTKPFDSDILLEKIKVLLKRDYSENQIEQRQTNYQIGLYQFELDSRKLKIADETIKLSPKEAGLLAELAVHQQKVLSRTEALLKLWGEDNYFTGRSMDVYLAKLRKHLAKDPSISITNVHGNGFILEVN